MMTHGAKRRSSVTPATAQSSLHAVQELLSNKFSGKSIRIYEAGGGSASFLPSILKFGTVTVLDIDDIQLQKNSYADHKVLGDVQTHAFPDNSFDLIICYNVIEHLDAPARAFDLFFKALAPGGLLFIGAPNPSSFSGWVVKITPHWFHVWYYRFVFGYKAAGQPGNMPFRTVYHSLVTPRRLINHCRNLGFRTVYFQEYQGDLIRRLSEQRPFLGTLLGTVVTTLNALTLWRRDLRNGDFHLILEKPVRLSEQAELLSRGSAAPSVNLLI